MGNKELKINVLKKAVIFPLAVAIILIFVASFVAPKALAKLPVYTDKKSAVLDYNPDDYYLVKYKNFSDLRLNNFTGWLSSDDLGLGCAVTFNSEKEGTDAASLYSKSTEPWNTGRLVITGDNTDTEFRNIHKAEKGDVVTIDFYGHDSYKYEVQEVIPIVSRTESYEYQADDTLVMCLPYNNFKNVGQSFYYTAVVATLVK